MKNWKPIAGALLIFVLGMVAGGVLSAVVVKKRMRTMIEQGPAAMPKQIVRRLDYRLHFTPGQRERVMEILTEAQKEMRSVRETARPQIARIMERTNQKIGQELDERQKVKFQELSDRLRRRWNSTTPDLADPM